MATVNSAREAFARVVRALEPYAADIVFVGGWVHELYLAEHGQGWKAIRTDDVDISIPTRLPTAGRPTLAQLVIDAGFEADPVSNFEGASQRFTITGPFGALIDLDIITEARNPCDSVIVDGQAGLAAQGYPGQSLLLAHARWIEVGSDVHASLDPPVRIRIPTVGAYALHKGLVSGTRAVRGKSEKDLVYLYEILRHPQLGEQARVQIKAMRTTNEEAVNRWCKNLSAAIDSDRTRRAIAQQLLSANQSSVTESNLVAEIRAEFRRGVAEV